MQNGKELWISRIYFPMVNPMDRVHDAWTRWHDSGPSRGCSGALSMRER
jgi:hypothetical protein